MTTHETEGVATPKEVESFLRRQSGLYGVVQPRMLAEKIMGAK